MLFILLSQVREFNKLVATCQFKFLVELSLVPFKLADFLLKFLLGTGISVLKFFHPHIELLLHLHHHVGMRCFGLVFTVGLDLLKLLNRRLEFLARFLQVLLCLITLLHKENIAVLPKRLVFVVVINLIL